ncbi:MAG: TerB family tellurite resistance protein [Acidobacteriota bacterium]
MRDLAKMDRDDRLQLMRFVCTFAWADLETHSDELKLIDKLVDALELGDDRDQIDGWLERPPAPEEVDPASVSRADRELLLDLARAVFDADGTLAEEEREQYQLLAKLLR